MHSDPDLIESILHSVALDLCAQYGEEISEMTNQLQKQSARITELRSIKEEEPGIPLLVRIHHYSLLILLQIRSMELKKTQDYTM